MVSTEARRSKAIINMMKITDEICLACDEKLGAILVTH